MKKKHFFRKLEDMKNEMFGKMRVGGEDDKDGFDPRWRSSVDVSV